MQTGETVAHGTADADASSAPGTQEDPSSADGDEEDHLLASPLAGRIVTVALVAGTAVMVGIVMVSFIEMVVIGTLGAVAAYLVAHDDGWTRQKQRRRARRRARRHIPVTPGSRSTSESWRAEDWSEDDVAGRPAA
ncbi:hypothetical protein [Rhodococcus spongiicola]|uniref:Uncharacterized protein n=1 Tax=Rhodococcus spongiicola TaxID=2487352 RepID=A0A3S3AHF1_9NOCA|nr:hypothetical protein [Rhodococcus spongiicola]RVW04688.1 hypothetical protein EF834_06585 [Rhodococcus spongiicola]